MPIQMDVTSSENIQEVLEKVIGKYRRPPAIIVNSAGITRDSFILKMDDDEFDLVMKVNLKASEKFNLKFENFRFLSREFTKNQILVNSFSQMVQLLLLTSWHNP